MKLRTSMKQLKFSALVYACCMVSQAHISPAFAHSWGEKKRGCTADHAGPKKKVRTSSYIIHFLLLLSDFFSSVNYSYIFRILILKKKLDLTDASFECTRKLKLDQFFLDYIFVPVKVIFSTGCLSAKGDVLTSWYDSDFRVRVKKNRFLWSWVAEIYAWTTNLDFFDLTQPLQPHLCKMPFSTWKFPEF